MLDTNMVSYIVKGQSAQARIRLASLPPNRIVCLSTITEGELHYGLARISEAARLRESLQWFLARIEVLSWGREAAAAYGDLRAKQEAAGRPIGNMDLLIAAHAVSIGAILVTADKAFAQLTDLVGTENWASDLKP